MKSLQNADKQQKVKPKQTSNKPTYKQVKEYEALEGEIEQLETRKSELMEKLNAGTGTSTELTEWSQQIGQLIKEIEDKSDRWLELSEIVEA